MGRMIPEVSALDLKVELDSPTPPTLIDVREGYELDISRFPQYVHVPMRQLASRLAEFDPESDLVIVCRTGNRSGQVTSYMLHAGFKRVRNLVGGINGWAVDVDPSLPRY
jgi:sulfur-carrier protein adenylyltransferase/sulfurtransferase